MNRVGGDTEDVYHRGLSYQECIRGERYSHLSTFLNMAFFSITGIGLINGVFLTCYAGEMGATNLHFSVIASLWSLSSLPVVLLSYLIIDRMGRKKILCVLSTFLMSLVGFVMGFISQLSELSQSGKIWTLLGWVFFGHLISNLYFVTWLSWIPEFVPDRRLGKFQGIRIRDRNGHPGFDRPSSVSASQGSIIAFDRQI